MSIPARNRLAGANRACLGLWRDERGSILALSVIIYLCLFMMTCGIYAVGETARKRMELQNTADAAAYSGTLVQADGLSRIAAYNRALGWVYIQLGRAQMDHAVDMWLGKTLKDHRKRQMMNAVMIAGKPCPSQYTGKYLGRSPGIPAEIGTQNQVFINDRKWYDYVDLARKYKASAPALRRRIDGYQDMIKALNLAVKQTVEAIKPQVEKTVEEVVKANLADSPFEARNDIRYSLVHHDAREYMVPLNSEGSLIKFGTGHALRALDVFEEGIDFQDGTEDSVDGWYVLHHGANSAPGEPGEIYREYEQKPNRLKSFWNWHWEFWLGYPPGTCEYVVQNSGTTTILGKDALKGVRKEYWGYQPGESEPVRTYIVGPQYFNGLGTISVAVSRRVNNPFEQLISPDGLFTAFTVDASRAKKAFMWALSSARAGYADLGRGLGGSDAGNYNNTIDSFLITCHPEDDQEEAREGWKENGWWGRRRLMGNLMISDWDSVFLPVARSRSARQAAWQPRGYAAGMIRAPFSPGKWRSDSGSEVMKDFWMEAQWMPVTDRRLPKGNGLATWASEESPSGLSGRQSYESAAWPQILH